MAKGFKIITLGCKVNQCESESLREALIRGGWRPVSRDEKADVSIVNTCIVTQTASYQCRQAIRRLIRENPGATVAAVGCYAQVFPGELTAIDGVSLIAGNTEKNRLPEILLGAEKGPPGCRVANGEEASPVLAGFHGEAASEPPAGGDVSGRTRGFLKIQDGCESFCTYCIVPYARGPLRSLDPGRVTSMVRSFGDRGFKEVVLTGIHLGKYGADLKDGTSLKELLKRLGKENLPLRIRLSSIEPKEIDEELLEIIAREPWLCKHFHIPLQSGDDGILGRMNRDYTSRDFAELIEKIHRRIPLASAGADVMVGFPGEDDPAFQRTCRLVEQLPISYLHVFPFSPRRGTPAATFKGRVKEKVTKERAETLRTLGQEKRRAFYRSCIGKKFLVLAEGWESTEKRRVKGFSDNYVPVVFPAPRSFRNEMVWVLLEREEGNRVMGTLVPPH